MNGYRNNKLRKKKDMIVELFLYFITALILQIVNNNSASITGSKIVPQYRMYLSGIVTPKCKI